MTHSARRLLAIIALSILAACGPQNGEVSPAQNLVPGYEAVQDAEYLIEAVDPVDLTLGRARREVDYAGGEAPGSIVVDTFARRLYLVGEGGRARSYAIAVGREGISFRGSGVIGRMEEWPSWQPTANMVRTRPDLYAEYAAGLPGGIDNPLGARALYLYRGGRDSYFRIHGTIQNATIGHATSAGCIRLFNQDAIDLYNRVEPGALVKVRSIEESLAIEGPYMDDAYGRAVPETPENIARLGPDAELIQADEALRLKEEAMAAERAEKDFAKAEKKRLAACRRQRIDADDCPPAPEPGTLG